MYDNISSLYTQSIPTGSSLTQSPVPGGVSTAGANLNVANSPLVTGAGFNSSKYTQLLAVIEVGVREY